MARDPLPQGARQEAFQPQTHGVAVPAPQLPATLC
jgi:hypothetical protein